MLEETCAFTKVGQVTHVAELKKNVFTSVRAKGLKKTEFQNLKDSIVILDNFLRLLKST